MSVDIAISKCPFERTVGGRWATLLQPKQLEWASVVRPIESANRRPMGRVLLLLAVDQRNSFERGLYGLKGPISSAEDARMSADKLLVYEALVEALPELPAEVQAGILVDEQYGASVAELASRTEGVVSLAMPIEKSGEDWFEFEFWRGLGRTRRILRHRPREGPCAGQPRVRPDPTRTTGGEAGPGLALGFIEQPVPDHRASGPGDRCRHGGRGR